MKVMFFFHETNPYNGAWKSAHNLLVGLREKGVELLVVTPQKIGIYWILKEEGFNVVNNKIVWNNTKNIRTFEYVIKRLPFDVRRYILGLFWWRKTRRLVNEFKPDIIHTNSSVFYLSYNFAKRFNIPHVWHIREYGIRDFNMRLKQTDKKLKEGYSYNICIAHDLQKAKGLEHDPRTKVIYNGVLSEKDITMVLPKSKYILFVGSMGEGKGIKDVLDGWKMFKQSSESNEYILKLAGGKEDERRRWEKYAQKIEIEDSVQFLGQRNDIKELMEKAYAVVMASYFEAFGRVTAEAMFYGSLVIGRDTAGTKEQFDNGLAMLGKEIAQRFKSTEELAFCLKNALNIDDSTYSTYVHESQLTVKSLYTIEAFVNSVYDFYKDIINK